MAFRAVTRQWTAHAGLAVLCIVGLWASQTTAAPGSQRQYTFSWQFESASELAPRGGMTRGLPVELATSPSEAWHALQAADLSDFERDRHAILAMVGEFRSSFDFIETVGFAPDYRPARPYQSWATELVLVAEDRGDFISLQHILVMNMLADDDSILGPFVTKHWRQDWHYQAPALQVHRGEGRWERLVLTDEQRRGAWVQSVYQVDDSPRYASFGRWQHRGGQSIWEGAPTWRPLPRREFEVRKDYDVLEAVNRHIITPLGWVHEEQNVKLRTGAPEAVVAREQGLNRYDRVVGGQDFTPGYRYWENTGSLWAEVRAYWERLFTRYSAVVFSQQMAGDSLFGKLFEYAESFGEGPVPEPAAARAFVESTIDQHVTAREPNSQ